MAKANETLELSFHGPEPDGSQSQVNMEAVITSDRETTNVKGFYDGNGTYKVRFLPMTAGSYHYKVTGCVSGEGTIEVEPADEKHHGIVRAEGTHLRHTDGTYITTFGTTVYALAHQTPELTEETFHSLECGAFNKIRMCVFPKSYVYNMNDPEHYAFYKDEDAEDIEFKDNLMQPRKVKPFDTNRPDFEFWKDFEGKLNRLADMGIQVDLILFHPYDRWGHSHMTQENNLRYLDYVIRRLSAFPNIWWSMANEYDLFFDWKIEQWNEIDEFISANDPYHHLLSNHNCFPEYDYSREAITHVSVQSRSLSRVAKLQKKFGKPVCYDECCYEGNLKETWGSISAKEMVNRFWKVTTTGGYCTHGEVLLDDDVNTQEEQDNAVLWWAKGGKLKGQSPERIKYLRSVIETLPAPLDPYLPGRSRMSLLTTPEMQGMLTMVPEGMRSFVSLLVNLDEESKMNHFLLEYDYAGHIGEDVYLFYLAENCCARYCPEVAQGKTYKAEAIDAWNMTRETIADNYKRGDELRLPGHEYMAVLLTAK